MDYDSNAFSINEDYGLDNIRFNQIFCRETEWHEEIEEEFKSLINFNKIDQANDPKFDDFYNDLENKIFNSLKHSIKLDNSEFVNMILQKSGIELGKFAILNLIRLYKEVRESYLANKSK